MTIYECIKEAEKILPNVNERDSHEITIKVPNGQRIDFFSKTEPKNIVSSMEDFETVTFLKCAVSKSIIKVFPLGPFKRDFKEGEFVIKWIPEMYFNTTEGRSLSNEYKLSTYLIKEDDKD